MQYKSNKGFTGISQLGIFIACMGTGLILMSLCQLIIRQFMVPSGTALGGMEAFLEKAIKDPAYSGLIILMQFFGAFFIFFVPAILFSGISNGWNKFWLGFNKYLNPIQILIGFIIIFFANIFAIPFEAFTKSIVAPFPSIYNLATSLEKNYDQNVAIFGSLHSVSGFIVGIMITAFLPALFEETMFRGVLQNFLTRWWKKPFMAILVISIIFSFIHGSIFMFIPRAILGFALGLMFYYTKNIWVNIVAHFLNNMIAFFELFFMDSKEKAAQQHQNITSIDWLYGLAAAVALFFLFRYLYNLSGTNRKKIEEREQVLLKRDFDFTNSLN